MTSSIEYGPQDYFPGAKLRLVIRFDEFGQASRLKPVPKKPTKALKGATVDPRSTLQVVPDPTQAGRLLIAAQGSSGAASGSPQVQSRSQDGLTFDIGGIIPHDAEWSQNGIRTADQLTATMRYVDCPIDPRTVRACAVEFYLGTVTAEDFQRGIAGGTRPGTSPGNLAGTVNAAEPLNLIPDTYTDSRGNPRTNLRFQGWVDKWTVQFTDSGEPLIRLECRDNTQLALEQDAPPGLVLDRTKPLDQAVATYLSNFPQFEGMSVEYRPTGATAPVLKAVLRKDPFPPPPAQGGGAKATTKLKVWDYLTDEVGRVGHSLFVDGLVIVIQRTRTFTTRDGAPTRSDDPFKGGRVLAGTGRKLDVRHFIWGRNLSELRISRNYTKNVAQNIEVRSYSSENKQVLSARFPTPAARQTFALPGDAQPDQKWLVLRVAGVTDQKQLQIYAQEVYEQIGRQEMIAELRTKNLASFGGDNLDPDTLDMKPGDTFELLINRDTAFSSLGKIEQALLAQGSAHDLLTAIGFSPEFASAYAKAYTDAGFLTDFRVKSMKTSWSTDEGISFSIQGANYIEVRADDAIPGESKQ